MITVFDQDMKAHNVSAEQIDEIADRDHALWIHLEGDDFSDFEEVADAYELHHLAIDNIIQPYTRSKISRYDNHILITTEISRLDHDFRLNLTQIAIFILPKVVITVVNQKIGYGKVIQSRLNDKTEIPERSEDFIVYAILDCIVDDFLRTAELLDEETENLETALFSEKPHESIQKLSFEIHRDLTDLRRIIMPMGDVMSSIVRRNRDSSTIPYFQEVYDHVKLATEWTGSTRDMVNNVLQTQISLQNNDLNATMKKLTAWAAIISVPAGITGFFGMNVPYPGTDQVWGVWMACIILVGVIVGLYWIFKKKEWL